MSIRYDVESGVATVTLDRPDALNALVASMKADLLAALTRAAEDDAVRAVLVTGAGKAFSAGQDLREHADNLVAGKGLAGTVRRHYNPIVRTITEMAKPVIAAVNGVAAGAGASLALACDLRIASENAKFAMAFAAIGLAPDSGASWTLPRLVGPAVAAELLMLGDPVSAERARELGLVSRVVPADELAKSARELAVRLAEGPTRAYAATKRALAFGAAHTLSQSLDLEADLQDACAATIDHQAATAAFVAKERPVFHGR
ncbi:enoyl-CoA hydratase [Spongiactinospora gelatinilytica]|uniref:Enoyl-CoA hydratase n=1 Tax=Spongiactinospora gelatinilytica TaxID=2666298 RepID=A0A2W2G3E4_9ACTN|nr:enoyl-CoA hydratase-related protein [Spongiactinospora gelatinilytica]PZG42641.1 enoyl-CoA hydratase [Spongiactinospora gelatinilytica]